LKVNACAAPDFSSDPNNPPQPNAVAGDIILHTVDRFNGSPSLGPGNVLFSLPASGTAGAYTVSGSLWDAGLNSSRPQDWLLFLNGAQIANGRLSGTVSRSQAQTFSVVESLKPGDQVEFQIVEDPAAAAGYFVGINLTITSMTSAPAQTITFGPLGGVTLGIAPFPIIATASSGLPVTFASTTPAVCTVSASTITILAAGTCSITASQPGSANYAAATPVTQNFTVTVSKGPLQIPGGGIATPVTLTGGTVAIPYSQLLPSSNGNPPYSWSVLGGGSPKGLSLSNSGTLSGTPSPTFAFLNDERASSVARLP
jgi:hypothetical protein